MDLSELTGYASETRRAWQRALYGHRHRMNAILVVGASNALIRMGASAVAAFIGVPIRFFDSVEALEAAEGTSPRADR